MYVFRDDSYDDDDQEGEREIVQQGKGKGEANVGKEGDRERVGQECGRGRCFVDGKERGEPRRGSRKWQRGVRGGRDA